MAITRKSDIIAVGDSDTDLLEAESAEDCVIVSLILGNVDGAADATVILTLTKSGESPLNIVSTLSVAAGEAVEMFIGGKGSLFLEPGDILSATASAAGDITATLSWLSEI
jgi:hypothetical protein